MDSKLRRIVMAGSADGDQASSSNHACRFLNSHQRIVEVIQHVQRGSRVDRIIPYG